MKTKQSVPILIPFLILVSMLFIGILIFTYVATKKANPQMIRTSSIQVSNHLLTRVARLGTVGTDQAG
jgi:hypothetical protein